MGDSDCEQLTFQFTKFRSHPYFLLFYQNLARLIILGILPFVMLIFFNCSIYFAIRRRQVRQRHQEENMAIVLMGIVSIFLVCNSFRIFLNFYEAVFEINKFHGTTDGPKTSLKQKQWFNNASI